MSTAAASTGFGPLFSDLIALTKPRVTSLVIATAAVGMGLAPGRIDLVRGLLMLAATVIVVGSANALNCWLERETDGFMTRTAGRPLPAGRLDGVVALLFGLALAVVSLPLLYAVNTTTGHLGLLALLSYVAVYTPMKFQSPHAMVVGAVPGALPPLMGWTAVTGEIGAGGLALFAIVFVWQMPHVIGLSMYRREEYMKAGIRVLPAVYGARVCMWHAIGWVIPLLPISASLYWLGLGGPAYLVVALALSAVYCLATLQGLWRKDLTPDQWGRKVFFASLMYLPLLFTVLMLDMVG